MALTPQQIPEALKVDLTRQVLLYLGRFNIRQVRDNRTPAFSLRELAFELGEDLGAVVVRVYKPHSDSASHMPVYLGRDMLRENMAMKRRTD